METDVATLREMIDYELLQSQRFRRFMTIALVTGIDSDDGVHDAIRAQIRESDVLAPMGDALAVLMGETDQLGAVTAAKRYREHVSPGIDLRVALATYPADGTASDALMDKASTRLKRAQHGNGYGVVVSRD